ncbi:hypothetical protein N9D31_01410 [Oligoflexaceae bacterium]|nr:hypothetical protein [Oligoflexaceae bacterium]
MNILRLPLYLSFLFSCLGCQSKSRLTAIPNQQLNKSPRINYALKDLNQRIKLVSFISFNENVFNSIQKKTSFIWLNEIQTTKTDSSSPPLRFFDQNFNILGLDQINPIDNLILDFRASSIVKRGSRYCVIDKAPSSKSRQSSNEKCISETQLQSLNSKLPEPKKQIAAYLIAEKMIQNFLQKTAGDSVTLVSLNLIPILKAIEIPARTVISKSQLRKILLARQAYTSYQPIVIQQTESEILTFAERSIRVAQIQKFLSRNSVLDQLAVTTFADEPKLSIIISSKKGQRSRIIVDRSYENRFSLEPITPIGAIDIEGMSEFDLVNLTESEWSALSKIENSNTPLLVPGLAQLKSSLKPHDIGFLNFSADRNVSSQFKITLFKKNSQSITGYQSETIESSANLDDLNVFLKYNLKKGGVTNEPR